MPTAHPILAAAATAALEPAAGVAAVAATGAAIESAPQAPGAPWLVITLYRRRDRGASYTIALRRTEPDGGR